MSVNPEDIRNQIITLTAEYHATRFSEQPFVPGKTTVPVAGRVFDADEMQHLVDAALDFWLTTGRFAQAFEARFAEVVSARHVLLVNSGSSANLLALTCLTSHSLGDRRLCPGDEVITVAAGFPTTVNPIVQQGAVPVFLDVTIPSYNIDVAQLDAARSPRTKAIIAAHTLGNPFDAIAVRDFARAHNLWFIEDCCDALGARLHGQPVGSFGDLATYSFYPAHHITMGEGGAVTTNDAQLKKLVESFRDWGRDCWCAPGHDNSCGRRFDWQLGELPFGYDHKYSYSEIGYNLKLTDMQAAVGLAQLKKLPEFLAARQHNYELLTAGLAAMEDIFMLPAVLPGAEPSWFGLPLAVRVDAPITRRDVLRHLDAAKIGTRLLFGGNLTRQPAYRHVPFRSVGKMPNSDFVMNQVFWIGVYPGIDQQMCAYIIEALLKTREGLSA